MTRYSICRRGFTLIELLVVIVVIAILMALLLPAIQAARESARASTCRSNMHQLGVALQTYHDVGRRFPMANTAHCCPMDAASANDTNDGKNWVIMLLPFMEQLTLYNTVDWTKVKPVPSAGLTLFNTTTQKPTYGNFTGTDIPLMMCPTDVNNQTQYSPNRNPSQFGGVIPQYYGRGNYGTNSCLMPNYLYTPLGPPNWGQGNISTPCGGPGTMSWNGPYSYMTRGVMGENDSLSIRQIGDGLSNTVALWEMRSGLAAADYRGSWADGRPGASTVWFHLWGPNVCGPMGEDTQSEFLNIYNAVAPPPPAYPANAARARALLAAACMYVSSSGSLDGTSLPRSMHPGGLFACFCDGSVRFISDFIERGPMVNVYGDFTFDNPGRMGVWERINASNDGQSVEDSQLAP